jgi:hypothetical protein
MANVHFMRKLAKDELWDTMFLASGEYPDVVKTKDFYKLNTAKFQATIYNGNRIVVNGTKCKGIYSAKLFIQENML